MTLNKPLKPERPFPQRCGACGKKAVTPATVPHVAEIKHEGKLHKVVVPELRAVRCGACNEVFFTTESDEQITAALRKQLCLLPPEQIRSNRERLGLKQRELAAHLGTADETISRWEGGLLIQSRAMDNLLRLYFTLPEVRTRLSGDQVQVILSVDHVDCGMSVSTPYLVTVRCPRSLRHHHTHLERPEVREALEWMLAISCSADDSVVDSVGAIMRSWGKIVGRVSDDLQQMSLLERTRHGSTEVRHLRRLCMLTENLAEMPGKDRDVVVRSMLPLTSRLAHDTPAACPPQFPPLRT